MVRLGGAWETMAREGGTILRIAAITGLVAEARIVQRMGLRAEAAGGRADATCAAIATLLAEGAGALMSFGICGGLDPALRPGALILPRTVLDEEGGRYHVDSVLHEELSAALAGAGLTASEGHMLGATAPAATPAGKAALHRTTGAAAIDLESHLVAGGAAAARIPFVVLRAVADPAERGLPPAALIGLDGKGRAAFGSVLQSIARQPGQMLALLQLALDTQQALAALRRAVRAVWRPLHRQNSPQPLPSGDSECP